MKPYSDIKGGLVMKKLNINNKGFTLVESLVALSLVTITATFAATAINATQKSVVTTKEISAGSDSAFSGCERFLATGSDKGKSDQEYYLKKTSGQLSGLGDIKLAIKDSTDG
jgi:prepilin-type N-terminal cleavage/methylation domain-containing protein